MRTEFETERLLLREWREADREPFAALNSNVVVMEFFPALIGREASDGSIDRWQAQIVERGWGNWAIEEKVTRAFIGFVGLSEPRRVLPCSPCIEIGWRLAKAYWGKGYATEAAQEALRVGFEIAGLAEIVSFTSLHNVRSQAVMQRLGMRNTEEDFDHPGVPEGHPLRRHCLYRLSEAEWRAGRSERTKSGR